MNAPGGEQLLGIAAIISSVMGPAVVIWRTNRLDQKVDAVKAEVTPNNGKTAGETSDAILSLQILAISPELRTPEQTEHLRAMAIIDPAAAVETLAAEILSVKKAEEE